MEVHCLQVLKIVHHYVNSCFDWLISGQQGVNPSREVISILSGKYKGFTFVHSVKMNGTGGLYIQLRYLWLNSFVSKVSGVQSMNSPKLKGRY